MAYDVAVDGSGNVHVAGTSGVVRYNSAGTQQWVGAFNGVAHALINVSGMVFATGVSGSDIVTARYDATGTRLWSTSYNLGGTEEAYALRLVGNNIYVAGWSGTDALLVGSTGLGRLAAAVATRGAETVPLIAFHRHRDFWIAGRPGDATSHNKRSLPVHPVFPTLALHFRRFADLTAGDAHRTGPRVAGGDDHGLNPASSMPRA